MICVYLAGLWGVYLVYTVFIIGYKQAEHADSREPSLDDAVWLVKGCQPSDPHVLPTGATVQLGSQLQPPPSSSYHIQHHGGFYSVTIVSFFCVCECVCSLNSWETFMHKCVILFLKK